MQRALETLVGLAGLLALLVAALPLIGLGTIAASCWLRTRQPKRRGTDD